MAEIKISDLSVGDWVSDKNGIIVQVRGIECWSDGYVVNVKTKAGTITNLTEEGVCPIPLLPKLLEKSGWECIAVGDNGPATPKEHYNRYEKWRYETKCGYRDLFFDRMTKRWRLSGMNCTTFTEFHKLQHALRISGFEKEIEL